MANTVGEVQNEISRPEDIDYNVKRFTNEFKARAVSVTITAFDPSDAFQVNRDDINQDEILMYGSVEALPTIVYTYPSNNEDTETLTIKDFWEGDWTFDYSTKKFNTTLNPMIKTIYSHETETRSRARNLLSNAPDGFMDNITLYIIHDNGEVQLDWNDLVTFEPSKEIKLKLVASTVQEYDMVDSMGKNIVLRTRL